MFYKKLGVLVEVITWLWQLQSTKTRYHFIPYHMRGSNMFESFPYFKIYSLLTSICLHIIKHTFVLRILDHSIVFVRLAFVFWDEVIRQWNRQVILRAMVLVT